MLAVKQKGIRNIVVEEVHDPVPQKGEVLLDVYASGICGSDVQHYYGSEGSDEILGHEFGGTIIALGEGVDENEFPKGSKVAVDPSWACGECY